jgi:hypothetical protein
MKGIKKKVKKKAHHPPKEVEQRNLGQVAPPHQGGREASRTRRISNSLTIITFFFLGFFSACKIQEDFEPA